MRSHYGQIFDDWGCRVTTSDVSPPLLAYTLSRAGFVEQLGSYMAGFTQEMLENLLAQWFVQTSGNRTDHHGQEEPWIHYLMEKV